MQGLHPPPSVELFSGLLVRAVARLRSSYIAPSLFSRSSTPRASEMPPGLRWFGRGLVVAVSLTSRADPFCNFLVASTLREAPVVPSAKKKVRLKFELEPSVMSVPGRKLQSTHADGQSMRQ